MIPKHITHPDPSLLLSDNYVVFDFETTNKDKGTALNPENRIVMVSYRLASGMLAHHYGNILTATDFWDALDRADLYVAHNVKFEMQWLNRLGFDASSKLWYDTLLGEYVINGNRRRPLDLGSISRRYLGAGKDPFVDILIKSGICPSEIPKEKLIKRCDLDVEETEAVFLAQREELKQRDQLKTLYTRVIFTPVLADMESRGIHLDKDAVNETYRSYVERFDRSLKELERVTGGINMRSPDQRAAFVYDELGFSEPKDRRGNPIRTPSNKRKADSNTFESFVPSTDRQRNFFAAYKEFQHCNAALTKSLQFFKGVVEESEDDVFYGIYNQAVTQTHRLSSSGRPQKFAIFGDKQKSVQFQNLPRIFKVLFSARFKSWLMGEIDGSQLEFRVAAHMGRDRTATEAIRHHFDVHKDTSSILTAAGQPTDRQNAKEHTFKPLYGGRSGTKAERTYYEAFRKKYPGITNTQEEWIQYVLAHKNLTIPSGLTFYWPNTKLEGDYITNTPSICNYPVQSYATADIIPIAVTYLWYSMKDKEMQSFLVNTIHDSCIGEIHPDEVELYKELGFYAFTEYVYKYLYMVYNDDFTVPLGAEAKIGTHWSKGEETKYDMEPIQHTAAA